MNRLSKQEKKERIKLIKAQETEELLASMPLSSIELNNLLDYLDSNLDTCDHSTNVTAVFLKEKKLNEKLIIPWLAERGGHCDCEVLLNLDDLAESLKKQPLKIVKHPIKKERKESRNLNHISGFDLSSLPKPWRINNLYEHNEPIQIQLGKKNSCVVRILEEPLPEGDKSSKEYWAIQWYERTELPEKDDMCVLLNSLDIPNSYHSACVYTKGWIPVLCWVYQENNGVYIEIKTEIHRQKGDLSEVDKLIKHIENKKA